MDYDFETFFDDSLDMLCIAGTDGYFKRLNPSFGRILGWSTEELLSRPFTDFIHPDDVDATLNEVERLSEGIPTLSFANRYRCANGAYRHLRWTAHPDPETGLLYAIARDVTELRLARQRFRAALEASPAAMLMVDDDGAISAANRTAEELFGYGPGDLQGKPIELLIPERYRTGHEALRTSYAGDPAARPMGVGRDLMARRSDGTEFPVEIGLNPLSVEDGAFVLAAITDLTERVRAARELERSNRDLETFAYVASHDLQEPLRMVAGYAHLLATRYGDQLDETGREYIRQTEEGATRMQELIRGLLEYSRLDSGEPAVEPVELDTVIEWARANLERAVAESGARIVHDSLPVVSGDRIQLGQLFQNLLGNAIKFRGEEAPRITVTASWQDGSWLVAVADNGIGIDEEFRDRVFEIFSRLNADQYEGTGIGLAVCQRIVERHGGRMWVESTPGEGATFFFTLPGAGPTPSPTATPTRGGST